HWLALALLAGLLLLAAKWIEFDCVRPAVGRLSYEIVCDDYGEAYALQSGESLVQTLTIEPGTKLCGVRFKHTASGGSLSGTLRVSLYGEDGALLRDLELDASQLKEDHFAEAVFDEALAAQGYTGRYSLEISFDGSCEGGQFALWRSSGQKAGFAAEGGTLVLQLAVDRAGSWITTAFWCVALFATAGLMLCYWLLFIKKVKFHLAFAAALAILGLTMALILPPMGAPDEDVHYATAYAYSNKWLGQSATDSAGWVIMRESDVPKLNPEGGISRDYDVFAYQRAYDSLRETEDGKTTTVEERHAYTIFKPLYFPQTLGIWLARLGGFSGSALQLAGRLMNFAFYFALCVLSVKLIPFGKAALALCCLLPMSLQIGASLCYDAPLLGMSFAFISLCLKLAYCEGGGRIWEYAALGLLALLIAPSKGIYLPLVGLLLIFAPSLWKSNRKAVTALIVLIAAAAGVWFAVNGRSVLYEITGGRAAVMELTNEQLAQTLPNGDAALQFSLGYMLARPGEVAVLLLRTLQQSMPLYLQGLIGGRLGEIILGGVEISWALVIGFIVLLLLSCASAPEDRLALRGFSRVLTAFIALVITLLTVLICMTWTPINYATVYGIQGRYLLPVLPLVLLCLRSGWLKLSKNSDDRALCFAGAVLAWLAQLDALSIIIS
ncbi:MAG: DUF2142 domain-containing protein, partial [Oscillospiraceae bacterium]|nr:DUF2142 domain-containing protein [Oscillospiraceae bacterium]